jgi:hypothetical protein
VSPGDAYTLRFVTHRHIGEAEIDRAVHAFGEVWRVSPHQITRLRT